MSSPGTRGMRRCAVRAAAGARGCSPPGWSSCLLAGAPHAPRRRRRVDQRDRPRTARELRGPGPPTEPTSPCRQELAQESSSPHDCAADRAWCDSARTTGPVVESLAPCQYPPTTMRVPRGAGMSRSVRTCPSRRSAPLRRCSATRSSDSTPVSWLRAVETGLFLVVAHRINAVVAHRMVLDLSVRIRSGDRPHGSLTDLLQAEHPHLTAANRSAWAQRSPMELSAGPDLLEERTRPCHRQHHVNGPRLPIGG